MSLPGEAVGLALDAATGDPAVDMAWGRLNVDRGRFFEEGLLVTCRPAADQTDPPAAAGSGRMSRVANRILRAQLGNEAVKRARWWTGTAIGPMAAGGPVTRNSLIDEPVVTLDGGNPDRTDILQEYFVAPERFAGFLRACREVIPASYQELPNVTLRHVGADAEGWLSYAPGPRIAAVMLFSQEMTTRAEADMAHMTRALVDQVLDLGGT